MIVVLKTGPAETLTGNSAVIVSDPTFALAATAYCPLSLKRYRPVKVPGFSPGPTCGNVYGSVAVEMMRAWMSFDATGRPGCGPAAGSGPPSRTRSGVAGISRN